MSDEARGKVFDFLERRNRELLTEARMPVRSEDRPPLHFAIHSLAREDGILMTRPLFELILMRLWEGSPDAKALAQMMQESTNITVPRPT